MGLMGDLEILKRVAEPYGEMMQYNIKVFAIIDTDKKPTEELPKEYYTLPFEPFIGAVDQDLTGIDNLGQLNKYCKKNRILLDILPVNSLFDTWDDEKIDNDPMTAL